MAILISLGSKRHAALAQLRWRPHILGVIRRTPESSSRGTREKKLDPGFRRGDSILERPAPHRPDNKPT
jgi:hypothetical protein